MGNVGDYILVVDDEESIREFVQVALAEEGYDVVTVSNGRAALAIVEDRPPRLILLDMRMPLMDGWEFARQYRMLPEPHAPLIALTAARDTAVRAAQINAASFLAKPFDLEELFALVEQYIERSSG